MSWSFYTSGSPVAVADRAKIEAETPRCQGVEEVARVSALKTVESLCREGMHGTLAVKVEASGSAFTRDGVQISNAHKLSIEPIGEK